MVGNALVAAGDADGALLPLTRAVYLDPSATNYASRAAAHLQLRQLALAIADATRALVLNPDSAKAHRVLGRAVRARGGPSPADLFPAARGAGRALVRAVVAAPRRRARLRSGHAVRAHSPRACLG